MNATKTKKLTVTITRGDLERILRQAADAFTTAASQAARDAAARADEKHGELVRALFCGVAENITALKTDCLDAHFGPEPPYPMTPAVTVSAAAVVVDTDQADAEAERQRLMDQAECKW
ncbi:MAG TPA: hypothetical protein VN641_11150 [Urbifossiella sp.]|nr:hypothetical protein [Urbifossiella sp.]